MNLSQMLRNKTIGSYPYLFLPEIKKLSLFFDHIAIPELSNQFDNAIPEELRSEFTPAIENQFLINVDELFSPLWFDENYLRFRGELFERLMRTSSSNEDILHDWQARITSYHLKKERGIHSYPIIRSFCEIPELSQLSLRRETIASIVIENMPVPDESMPWRELFDLKNEPETQRKFLALKNWINDLSRSDLSPQEIQDKIRYLLSEYERYMEIMGLRYRRTKFEIILLASATMIENIVRLQFASAIRELINLRHENLMLLETELTAPGREIAYISHLRERFNRRRQA